MPTDRREDVPTTSRRALPTDRRQAAPGTSRRALRTGRHPNHGLSWSGWRHRSDARRSPAPVSTVGEPRRGPVRLLQVTRPVHDGADMSHRSAGGAHEHATDDPPAPDDAALVVRWVAPRTRPVDQVTRSLPRTVANAAIKRSSGVGLPADPQPDACAAGDPSSRQSRPHACADLAHGWLGYRCWPCMSQSAK